MIRFGVAHRLTAGLLALTFLAMLAAGLALSGIDRFRDGFDHIAIDQVGDLVAVARLAQQAQAIAVTAPRLVAAGDRFERERAIRHLDDLFRQLTLLFDQAEPVDPSADSVRSMRRYQQDLTDNLDRLDRLVADRHAREQQFQTKLSALSATAREAGTVTNRLLSELDAQFGAEADPGRLYQASRRLQHWQTAINEGSMAAVLVATAPTEVVVDRIAAASMAAAELSRTAAAEIPEAPMLATLSDRIATLTTGPEGAFAARRSLLTANRQAQGVLNRINIVSGQFVAAAANLFADALADIEQDRAQFRSLMHRGANILAALVVASLAGAALVFLYLRHRVIGRLVALSRCMRDRADGRAAAIPVGGGDELADMARAFAFFVNEIDRREAELRTAKDAAETALRDLQATQDHLLATEKLAALGSLVAGIAHEINTPIGVALTGASHIVDRCTEIAGQVRDGRLKRQELDRFLSQVGETGTRVLFNIDRAVGLIQSFKQVAVDQTRDDRRRFRLGAYLHDIVASFDHRLRAARIKTTIICDDEIEIDGNPGAFAQIVSNLIMNSLVHGFDGRDGGAITIEARRAGERILVTFADDGVGMEPEILVRAFEPFFTTKRGQGGTGLGLHIVHNIVQKSLGGRITAESHRGIGTRLSILIPAVAPAGVEALAG